MIKGTKCDNCNEEIFDYGYHLHLQGLDYYFCDKECAEAWLSWLLECEDVIEADEYDV